MFAFVPRRWPFIWETLIRTAGDPSSGSTLLSDALRDTLMHQDIESYAIGVLAKIKTLIAAACAVFNRAYDQFKDMPENQSALIQLKSNFKQYRFEHFVDPAD